MTLILQKTNRFPIRGKRRLLTENIFDIIYHEDIDEYWKDLGRMYFKKNEVRFFHNGLSTFI